MLKFDKLLSKIISFDHVQINRIYQDKQTSDDKCHRLNGKLKAFKKKVDNLNEDNLILLLK